MFNFGLKRAASNGLTPDGAKRTQEDVDFTDTADSLQYEDYTVGWICALPLELAAAEAMLDDAHEPPQSIPRDINTYKFGRIGPHNVVLACLPLGSYGTNSAAMVAAHMSRSFPTITTRLMVGVGGGAPSQGVDIRLGDVVVGKQVIQYDLGKATAGGQFDRIGDPVKPPPALLTAVSNLASTHSIMPLRISTSIRDMLAKRPHLSKFGRPKSQDVLFKHTYDHPSRADTCDACDPSQQVHRQPRPSDDPIIHYGKIASGNRVIKDGTENQRLARELNVLCFEMEAAGLNDHFPCLVIRGICDYADSHKNKVWQEYAASTAAAYAKEVLLAIPAERNDRIKWPPPPLREPAVPDNEKSLLKALSFPEISSRQIGIKPALSKTCEWFLDDDAYLDWLRPSKLHAHHGFLWISGKPGAGKSTIMKFVYERTEKRASDSSQTTVLSFFFNARGAALEKSTEGMYRSLLHQFFRLFPHIMRSLQESNYSAYMRDGSRSWSLDELECLLQDAVKRLGKQKLICFIDALDECDETLAREMVAFFENLCDEAYQNGTQVYVCFSSRHFPNISVRQGSLRVVLEKKEGHGRDIDEYIKNRLRGPTSQAALQELRNTIRDKASSVFMWVVLVVDILNKELQHGGTIAAAKRRLEKLPSKLGDLFKDILLRDGTDKDDLLLCIGWILYAKRPLKCAEFYYALQAGLNPEDEETLAKRDPNITTDESMRLFILHKSKGLAGITAVYTVEFIHESVRDFLIKDNGIKCLWPAGAEDFECSSHDRLKDCCLFYLKVDFKPLSPLETKGGRTRSLPRDPDARRRTIDELKRDARKSFPFLESAARVLLHHANSAGRAKSQTDFLKSMDFNRWLMIENFFNGLIDEDQSDSRHMGATLVDLICERGHTALLKCFFDSDLTITFPPSQRYQRRHPVLTAIRMGDFELAKRLATRFDVNAQDADGRTLVSVASGNGLEDLTVYLLKDLHADINIRDHAGCTALLYASRRHYNIVRHIVSTEGFDAQAISCPVELPQSSIWARVSPSDKSLASSPLWEAIRNGQDAIARILLDFQIVEAGLNLDLAGALVLLALGLKHNFILQMLFDVLGSRTTNLFHTYGQEILAASVVSGNTEVVDQLLRVKGLDWNRHNGQGNAPLTVAAWDGDDDMVRKLLAIDSINVNGALTSSKGGTPLFEAVFHGHRSVTKQLLLAPGIDVNMTGSGGQTPLLAAVLRADSFLVEQLLNVPGIDVNIAETTGGETPLIKAAHGGDYALVERLVGAKGIDPNRQNTNGDTALILAARSGSYAITGALLSAEGIDASLQNDQGMSALAEAVSASYHVIVELLLRNAKKIDVNVVNRDGRTPLMLAALRRDRWDLEVLLAAKEIDVNAQDKLGRTALSICTLGGHVPMLELLLARDDVDLELADKYGNTPLSLALMEELEYSAYLLRRALDKKVKTQRSTSAKGGK